MSYPKSYQYTKDHEWIEISGSTAKVGVTRFAIDQLGDVVHLDLPKAGATFASGASFGTIESTKTVSDLYMPVAGTIAKVNSDLVNAPERIAEDPHANGWLVEVTLTGTPTGLLSAAEYEAYIHAESHK